jgi:uncharacterized membrane protein
MLRQQSKFPLRLFWSLIILLSGYYLFRAIRFRFIEEGIGDTFWNKQFWFIFHLLTAILPLALGPFQFWSWFRKRYIRWHRLLGKIYIIGSLLGGLTALYLGFTQPYQGSIVPVVLLALLWLFCTTAAWITIRRKNVQAHRLFMIRSYVLALTFISLRILSDMVEHWNILFFIDDPDVRDTTYEWLSWVLPLMVTEICISWIPSMRMSRQMKTKAAMKQEPSNPTNRDTV